MNGQRMNYKKYFEYISTMPDPIMPSQLPKKKLNLRRIAQYAKEHNICFADLPEKEREQILSKIS